MIAIFVNGANDHYTRGYNFPIGTTQKKSVFELGVIFWGSRSPLFLAILGLCHDRGIATLNFGPISTKLGGTVWVLTQKITQNDISPLWGHRLPLTALALRFGQTTTDLLQQREGASGIKFCPELLLHAFI